MSDYIFTSHRRTSGYLSKVIQSIYHDDKPEVTEFHGSWGSLAFSRNLYLGYEPMETDDFICGVIGGPVLTFTDNNFLTGKDKIAGTRYIYEKWLNNKYLKWDEVLSGPFQCLFLNKCTRELQIVTDLLSFIPLYEGIDKKTRTIGTHVDMVARTGSFEGEWDLTSLADFILNGTVTYPFTTYQAVRELAPASSHNWNLDTRTKLESESYWQPLEEYPKQTIEEMAEELREGLRSYVGSVTQSMNRVATFLSGGEDSRVILSLLPADIQREAFIFLNQKNRESRIAQRVARVHGVQLMLSFRHPNRYLEVLPACSDLVGSTSQYISAHTYGLHIQCNLIDYPAVFGGLLSDTLLKEFYYYNFHKPSSIIQSERYQFTNNIFKELNSRHRKHLRRIKEIRPCTAHEWFSIWPMSMCSALSNIHGNRRLFRSYEPFTASSIVKIASVAPQQWKLNRNLFHHAVQPLLNRTKKIPHPNGWQPYQQGWKKHSRFYENLLTRPVINAFHKKQMSSYQGTWCDWNSTIKSKEWALLSSSLVQKSNMLQNLFTTPIKELLNAKSSHLSMLQKVNLLQALYFVSSSNGRA